MSEQSSDKRVIGLDIARAAAILAVLTTHLTIRWYDQYPFMRIALLFLGMMGVELFFVLSGFLIGGILLRQAQREPFTLPHVPRFWMRRWFRTLPNYYLFLGLLALLFPNPTPGQLRYFLVFGQNLFRVRSDWFVVSWSLCIEEWMYLLLPILLLLFTRLIRHPQRAAQGAIATLLIVPTLLRLSTYGMQWDSGVRHVVIYNLDAIAFGVALAYIQMYHPMLLERLRSPAALYAGLLLAAVLIWFNPVSLYGQLYYRSITGFLTMHVLYFSACRVAMFLVVAFLSGVRTAPRSLVAPITCISLWSYSIYLSHFLIMGLVGTYTRMGSIPTTLLTLLLIFIVSAVVYRFYEKPMTDLRDRKRKAI